MHKQPSATSVTNSGDASRGQAAPERSSSRAFYIWAGVALAVAVTAVTLGWHAQGGTPDPTDPANHMSPTAAVINSAILVFREGLETILVLAAVMASFRGSNQVYRRPVAAGGTVALAATVATWFVAAWAIGQLGGRGLNVQAATGLPAIIVLLIVMNWFFHRVYWTGWIAHHHSRRRGLLAATDQKTVRRTLLGFALLGFTSVYREGFEIVVFLQNLRVTFGSSVVLEGVTLGVLFTTAAGLVTFGLHRRLPYRRLLIITGAMLVAVLFVMVGEEINEMQLAGWIPTTSIGVSFPGWTGQWFSLFGNVQTIAAQLGAVTIVVGSYLAAQYLRVWRPRRRSRTPARVTEPAPQRPAGIRELRPAELPVTN